MPIIRALAIAAIFLTSVLASTAGQAVTTANAIPGGFVNTQQNKIVDSQGREVRLIGLNWFGLETPDLAPHGLWARSYRDMLDQIASLGFNTIRLPFSSAVLTATSPNTSVIKYRLNPDLEGKTPLEIMDAVIAYAGSVKLRVILDNHNIVPEYSGRGDGRWYNNSRTESKWIADWKVLAKRYLNNTTVIGADLYNEPDGTWGTGGTSDWARAAKAAGDAIHQINNNWLIIVEGLRNYNTNYYWWGGQLEGVANYPVQLARANKLVYSAHDYPPSINPQPWFIDTNYPTNLPAVWEKNWGFIETNRIAPVLLGEFGSRLATDADRQWAAQMQAYLVARKVDWTWWSWNGNGEPRGLLLPDWQALDTAMLKYLTDLMTSSRP